MEIGKRIGMEMGKATRVAFGEALRDLLTRGVLRDDAPQERERVALMPHGGREGGAEGVVGIARGQVEDGPWRQRRPGRVGRQDAFQEGLLVGEAGEERRADDDLGQWGALA